MDEEGPFVPFVVDLVQKLKIKIKMRKKDGKEEREEQGREGPRATGHCPLSLTLGKN